MPKFRVLTHLDGVGEVTVEVKATAGKTDAVVSVRPKRKRVVYTGMLSDVAQFVAARHAKALVAAQGLPIPRSRRLPSVVVWAALGALLELGCSGAGFTLTQMDPVNVNEVYMLGEVKRIEGLMSMGAFVAEFTTPPASSYAGWAKCRLGEPSRPPFLIGFNKGYVSEIDPSKMVYMTSLVAHEMCHHWVANHGGACYDEVAAENCAAGFGR